MGIQRGEANEIQKEYFYERLHAIHNEIKDKMKEIEKLFEAGEKAGKHFIVLGYDTKDQSFIVLNGGEPTHSLPLLGLLELAKTELTTELNFNRSVKNG